MDSRRYHRHRPPSHTRSNVGYSGSWSNPVVVSPFHQLPYAVANQYQQGFATPFARGLGGRDVMQQFGQQGQQVMQSLVPQAQQLGPRITNMTERAYGGYQKSLDDFLSQLPGYQKADTSAIQGANTIMQQAFSPVTTSSLFNTSVNQALGQARLGEAARGMIDTGASGAFETQNVIEPLANQYMQQQMSNETAAVQNMTSTTGAAAQTAALGPTVAGQGIANVLPAAAQTLTGAMNLPYSAASNVLSYLTQGKNPLLSILQMTAPQVAQKTASGSGSGGYSDLRLKDVSTKRVPGLEAALKLSPVTFVFNRVGLPPGEHVGLVAQEVQPIVPTAVDQVGDYLAIDYKELVPVLIQAIQDLHAKVADLESKLASKEDS